MGRPLSKMSRISNPTVQIDANTKDELVEWLRCAGHSQSWAVSRVLKWFVHQPPHVKRVVLGQTDEMMRDYAAALRSLADQVESGADEPDRILVTERLDPPRR